MFLAIETLVIYMIHQKKKKKNSEPFFVWKKILFDLKTMTLSSLLGACLKAAFWFFCLLGCDVHMVPSFSQKTEKKSVKWYNIDKLGLVVVDFEWLLRSFSGP